MPLVRRSSATWPLTDCDRMVEAAVTAASAAAARTSASAIVQRLTGMLPDGKSVDSAVVASLKGES